MPSMVVADVLSDLQKYYSKELTESQIQFYQSQLTPLDDVDLCAAVVSIKAKEAFFPMVSMIRKYFFEAREQRLNRDKERAPIFDDIKQNAGFTRCGVAAVALMESLYAGTVTREQYLAKMYEFENRAPGFGWKRNADQLKAFWDSEEERHAVVQKYLERIWRLQDARGLPSYNSPEWYLETFKEKPVREPGDDDD